MPKYETWAVLAGAYRGADLSKRSLLTHTVCEPFVRGVERVLCRKVNMDSLTQSEEAGIDSKPTCPVCAKRDPRFKTK